MLRGGVSANAEPQLASSLDWAAWRWKDGSGKKLADLCSEELSNLVRQHGMSDQVHFLNVNFPSAIASLRPVVVCSPDGGVGPPMAAWGHAHGRGAPALDKGVHATRRACGKVAALG
jgi:hypothetical protein